MKKSILIMLLAFFYANLSQAQCPPTFADDFESGTLLPHWSSQAATLTSTISSTGSFQGVFNVENNGNSGHANGLKGTFTSSQPSAISWYMKTNTLAISSGYFVVGDNATSSNFGILFCYFSGSGDIRFYANGTTYFNVPATANTWYFIEIKNINWTAKTLDVYINSVLQQANFPFRSTGSIDVSEIHLYNLNAATVNYDDIKIIGAPSAPIGAATPDSICAGQITKVTAVSTIATDSIRWYDSVSGGNLLATTLGGDSLTLTPTTDTTLYAEIYAPSSVTDTFNYTGGMQNYVVPAGVTELQLETWGAQGGANNPINTNYGGYSKGKFMVTPGDTLRVYVGEQPTGIIGGFNGGGNGETAGAGGGGASDVRLAGGTLNDRIIVAGGAGGAGFWSSQHVVGGVGGGLVGGDGYRSTPTNAGGQGGTQTGSGTGTCASLNNPAVSGGFGFGGSPSACGCEGYGGGGGWYGGAGSGNCRGGGGGSGYLIPSATDTATASGVRVGNGMVVITYSSQPCSSRTSITITVDTLPNVTATPSNVTSCYGDSVTLVGGGANTYSWSGGVTNNTPFLPSASTVYTVTGTDANGCSNTATSNVILGTSSLVTNFADDFETGTILPHWTSQAATLISTISSTGSIQGTFNIENTGSSGHTNGLKGTFAASQPTEISLYMKTNTNTTTSGYVVIGPTTTVASLSILFAYFSSAGNLRLYATATTIVDHPVSANTWYFLQLKNINWTTRTFDIYINNTLIQASFPFRNQSATSVSEIHLYNLNASTVNYDDIQIKSGSLKLSNATANNAASTAGTGTGAKTQNTSAATEYYDGSCDLIAEISNNASSLGNTVANVTVDAVVPTHNGQPFTARWFEISPTNNVAADVKLFFTQDDFDEYNLAAGTSWPFLPANPTDATGIANMRVTKNDNGGLGVNPVVLTPSSVTWNAPENRWEVMVNVPRFSQFRVHAANPNNTPLPVTFTNFTVRKEGSTDLVAWTTKSEYNNSHFDVQRSADGFNFENLGTVNTKAVNGNSNVALDYEFVDEQPMIGHNYYRLQQVDLDHRKHYSDIVDIIWTNGSVVTIYPNPTRDILNIDLSTDKATQVEVKLLDMSGRVVKSVLAQAAKGANNIKLSLSDIAPSVYSVQVYENNKLTHVEKVRKSD